MYSSNCREFLKLADFFFSLVYLLFFNKIILQMIITNPRNKSNFPLWFLFWLLSKIIDAQVVITYESIPELFSVIYFVHDILKMVRQCTTTNTDTQSVFTYMNKSKSLIAVAIYGIWIWCKCFVNLAKMAHSIHSRNELHFEQCYLRLLTGMYLNKNLTWKLVHHVLGRVFKWLRGF